jgi:nicotinamidase-related amidase
MKTLVIVDLQKDFYDPSGALYVKGGEKVVEEIKKLILTDLQINQVIFTVDWHTPEDYSFKKNGGEWPVHCLQYSEGASLPKEVMEAIMYRGFTSIDGSYYKNGETDVNKFFLSNSYDVFQKGDIPGEEEYGAFREEPEQQEGDEDVWCMTGASGDSCAYLNVHNDVVVCGLAGDFCVLETAKNLMMVMEEGEGTGKLMMYLPGIACIDDGTKLKKWMEQEKIEEYIK